MNTEERFSLAESLAMQGQSEEAARVCQEILADDSGNHQVHHLLGVIWLQQYRSKEAVMSLEAAVRFNPDTAIYHSNLGLAYIQLRQYERAIECCKRAIECDPILEGAYNNLGLAYQYLGQNEEAIVCFDQALRLKPDYSLAHHNLARSLRATRQFEKALIHAKEAIRLQPNYVEAMVNLGSIYFDLQQWKLALHAFLQVIQLEPSRHPVYQSIALIYMTLGEFNLALQYAQKAIELNPKFAKGYYAMGLIHGQLGQQAQALEYFKQATKLDPNFSLAYYSLGNILSASSQFQPAKAAYEKAIALEPNRADFYLAYGNLLANSGLVEQSLPFYDKAWTLNPNDGIRMTQSLLLPVIYPSLESVGQWRNQYEAAVERLLQSPPHIEGSLVNYLSGSPYFYLAYQNCDDRPVLEKLSQLFQQIVPRIAITPTAHEKPKIGFISRLLNQNHTLGKLMAGIIDHLSRERFDVVVFHFGGLNNPNLKAPYISVQLPFAQLEKSQELIAQHNLDVLFYADIGMDPLTYLLAFSRLAKVQCVTWGHPVTTGIPTMDYFISSEWIEPENAQDHYTEKLVRLKSLPTYYYKPQLPETLRSRHYFGLPEEGHIYLCPQTLFKIHPDFDWVIGEILRRDEQGMVVLVSGQYEQWRTLLAQRFGRSIPDVLNRIVFLPRLTYPDFLNILACSDVMLDTFYFGGGNTTYEALALGLPIVTMPGTYMRGRAAYGCYQKMGLTDCVTHSPEAYVSVAIRLGTDKDYRSQVSQAILDNNSVLFEDKNMIEELEAFFIDALRQAETPLTTLRG